MKRGLSLVLLVTAALSQTPGGAPYKTGLDAFAKRDFATAQREFQRAVDRDPQDARAHKLLGMALAAQESYDSAAVQFGAACQLNPGEPDARYYLGRSQLALGRLREAVQSFNEALHVPGVKRGRVLLGLALTYEALPESAAADRFFRDAIAEGERQALVDYGLFLAKQGRATEALAFLNKAGARAEAARVEAELRNRAGDGSHAAQPVSFRGTSLPMRTLNGATGEKHLIETMTGGVAAFDYDGDGWTDIFVVNGATVPGLTKADASFENRLFRNNHDGGFSDVTAAARLGGTGYSMGAAAADFDNDGHVDLFVAGVDGGILYRNRGDGSFENITAGSGLNERGKWSVAAGWFDYDNDGLLDLFVVHYVVWTPALDIYCGPPSFRQYCNPRQYRATSNALYRNLGNGRFRDVSEESGIAAIKGKGMSVAFGDSSGDGRLDVFITNDTLPNTLLKNEGNGKFHDIAVEAGVALSEDGSALSSMGVDFRDYDNDGREDLFVTALSDETFPLWRNIGGRFAAMGYLSGMAAATRPYTGWGTGMFDFNNDGRKDLFVAGGHVMDNAELSSNRHSRQPSFVLLNTGGRFTLQKVTSEALYRGAAFADFDRDGRMDVVVTRLNEAPLVLRNTTVNAGHWLALDLRGHASNRDGVGALIHIRSAGGQQWNRVTTAVGYASSSDRRVHFGIGADRVVDSIEIQWPSGRRSKLANVEADRLVAVEEPCCLP